MHFNLGVSFGSLALESRLQPVFARFGPAEASTPRVFPKIEMHPSTSVQIVDQWVTRAKHSSAQILTGLEWRPNS